MPLTPTVPDFGEFAEEAATLLNLWVRDAMIQGLMQTAARDLLERYGLLNLPVKDPHA